MLWCRGSGIASKARGIRAVAWASIPKLLGFGIQLFEKRSFATGRKAIVNQTNAQAQDYDMPRLLAIALEPRLPKSVTIPQQRRRIDRFLTYCCSPTPPQ